MSDEMTIVIRCEDDAFWATVNEFPGVFATGATLAELRESLAEGISLWLAAPDEEPRRVVIADLVFDEPLRASLQTPLLFA